jgi:hypothetical protein
MFVDSIAGELGLDTELFLELFFEPGGSPF